jgi:glyoxylase-like metal-dependent hydrolase (beta-lactamase superfamily II)
MFIAGFPAKFGTNCYVVAPGPGERCVVIDPGHNAMPGVQDILREHRLKPAAVIITHGHVDHMLSVTPVCGAHDIPAYVHPDDRYMLTEPLRGSVFPGMTERQLAAMVGQKKFTEPSDVRELKDGQALGLGLTLGFDLVVDHAPGHTRGSVTFRLARGANPARQDPGVLFTGDLLFAGSVGRTDLPGGDPDSMLASLARVVLPLPDDTVVLAGHGPQTTVGRERVSNPGLQGLRNAGRRWQVKEASAPPR